MIMNNYVSDELANKVHQLFLALNQAQHIIDILQEENESLRKVLELYHIVDIPSHTEESCVISY